MEKQIKELLIKVGISPALLGFEYIPFAVKMLRDNKRIKITVLYSEVAKEFDTTPSRVERAIRFAISKFDFERNITKRLFDEKRITNSDILFTLAYRLEDILNEDTD